MRRIREAVLPFAGNNDDLPKTVREYRKKYKGVSRILDAHPKILGQIHEDLKRLSSGGRNGRGADFSSETILRALVVHAIEGGSLRETVVRIAESEFLQDFLRTRKKAVMDHGFLDRCFQAVRPTTWKQVNAALAQAAVKAGMIDPSTIRADTTAVETNIHWPTDASLPWDTWRVAARLLRQGRAIAPDTCPHRFHDRKTKRLYLFITRYAKSENARRQRKVRTAFRQLIVRVEWIVEAARWFCEWAPLCRKIDLADAVLRMWRSFRAGIEGTISGLKRAFRLARCHYRGFKRLAAAVGLGVFSHNLIVLAKQAMT